MSTPWKSEQLTHPAQGFQPVTDIPFPKRICIDFDGVICNTQNWVDETQVLDGPVDGAFQAIEDYLEADFRVAIYSSRSYRVEALQAIMCWFRKHGMRPEVLDHIEFPPYKPGAVLYIDDRGFHFRGIFPHVSWIKDFKPWNKP
jgi:hypothetical protein